MGEGLINKGVDEPPKDDNERGKSDTVSDEAQVLINMKNQSRGVAYENCSAELERGRGWGIGLERMR